MPEEIIEHDHWYKLLQLASKKKQQRYENCVVEINETCNITLLYLHWSNIIRGHTSNWS
jgi:hypothetical protein